MSAFDCVGNGGGVGRPRTALLGHFEVATEFATFELCGFRTGRICTRALLHGLGRSAPYTASDPEAQGENSGFPGIGEPLGARFGPTFECAIDLEIPSRRPRGVADPGRGKTPGSR